MYQTDDIENGITIKDCFKNLVELAWETRELDEELANRFFDILVECLGIDFRLSFLIDKELAPNGNTATLILNNFRNVSACTSSIDSLFSNFSYMVKDRRFSHEYMEYLQSRKSVLLELIAYQNNVVSKNNNVEEMFKLTTLNNDITLIDARLALVSEDLDNRGI